MAAAGTFRLSVVTPERAVWEGGVRSAVLPAHDGEIGFLAHRAPLICKLDAGTLKIEPADGGAVELFVDGGFAEMLGDRLTVLTEAARERGELERSAAEESLSRARGLPSTSEAEYGERQHALRRARVLLRLTGG
jgi:F-type H+-transporting ATPase subunit epsilon